MKLTFAAILGVGALAVILPLAVWTWGFFGPGGFTEGKSILADLQGLEWAHRHDILQTPEIFARYKDEGPVIVVKTFDRAFPYAWIAAAIPSCDGEVCMVAGNARLDIKCSDVIKLGADVKIAQSVQAKLDKSCRPD